MGSDFSRRIFDKTRNYTGALLQQGRVILDSDWNEQWDIYQHRLKTETIDVIGANGVPMNGSSFEIKPVLEGSTLVNLEIGTGRIYVDGLLCENHGTSESNLPLLYTKQPYCLDPNLGDERLLLEDGTHIVYLKAWQREVNYLEDKRIQEVALGEADTTVRIQTIWQVKTIKVEDNIACADSSAIFLELIKQYDGKIEVRTSPTALISNPCMFLSSEGYRRLENQLYRIQIHKGGDQNSATFLWSRDNGTVQTKIKAISGDEIEVESLGKDEYLGFSIGQYVEILDKSNLHNNSNGIIYRIIDINPGLKTIKCNTNIDLTNLELSSAILVRWDNVNGEINNNQSEWIDIEGGIQVKFHPGTYNSGDYWQIPARTLKESIEWPYTMPAPPMGTKYSYARLAIIKKSSNGLINYTDCREKFPTLTDLYDLYQSKDGCCTIHVFPESGWDQKLMQKFNSLANKKDAKICFAIGTYELEKPLELSDRGNLIVVGCGTGTIIRSKNSEAAFIFSKCTSVTLRDLYAESTITGKDNYTNNLNGVATFLNCIQVDVENSTFKTGLGSQRASTCITVRNDNPTMPVKVRIQNCELRAGHMQQGILLVNAITSLVENNNITVYNRPANFSLIDLIASDNMFKTEIAKWMVVNPTVNEIGTSSKSKVAVVDKNPLNTKSVFIKDFDKAAKASPPKGEMKKEKEIEKYKLELASYMLEKENIGNYSNVYDALSSFNKVEAGIGACGVTIGGKISEEIRIINNNITNFLEGIHIGLSHENETKEPYIAENVDISGNSIKNILPAYINMNERYGIFVGNTFNLKIRNNKIQLLRLLDYNKRSAGSNNVIIQGIRVWGVLGIRMVIADNTIMGLPDKSKPLWSINRTTSYDNAIVVNSIEKNKPNDFQWRIHDNIAISKSATKILIEPNSIKLNDDTGNVDDNV